MVKAQEYLNVNYPTQEKRKSITELDLSEKLNFSANEITSSNLTNCPKLTELKCYNNQLTEIKITLVYISISNNKFSREDISVFSKFTNLEELYIGNDLPERIKEGNCNHFTGSVKSLKNLTKLEKLQVEGTEVHSPTRPQIFTWGRKKIIKNFSQSNEKAICKMIDSKEAEKLLKTDENEFKEVFHETIINYLGKQLNFNPNLTVEQKEGIEKSVASVTDKIKEFGSKDWEEAMEKEINGLAEYLKTVIVQQRKDKQNKMTAGVVPLERLFVIRSSEDKDNRTELEKLKSPEQFNKFKYLAGVEWASTATTMAGGVLTLVDYATTGGVITLVAPAVDNYNELLGILKQVEVGKLGTVNEALKNLKDKVYSFLKEYDEDNDEEIDINELINERVKFNQELNKLNEIERAMKELEKEVIKYKKGSISEEKEEEENSQSDSEVQPREILELQKKIEETKKTLENLGEKNEEDTITSESSSQKFQNELTNLKIKLAVRKAEMKDTKKELEKNKRKLEKQLQSEENNCQQIKKELEEKKSYLILLKKQESSPAIDKGLELLKKEIIDLKEKLKKSKEEKEKTKKQLIEAKVSLFRQQIRGINLGEKMSQWRETTGEYMEDWISNFKIKMNTPVYL
ncbi:39500_t:CDS:2 [Gigaspora margarita]|uniref:39500_t:CDS:1 n=1 Tax=Gigaspora margarita TaxID=4874 RepID=A0ABM8VWE8_GIGMA|nr:39500_t:CDS:2 [Gigaspora margarita]